MYVNNYNDGSGIVYLLQCPTLIRFKYFIKSYILDLLIVTHRLLGFKYNIYFI